MEKILITGFTGFVSRHFIDYLERKGVHSEILGIDICDPRMEQNKYKHVKLHFKKIDLLDKEELENVVYSFQPQYALHLASFSSVSFSWENPILSFKNNTNIFLNLLEVFRKLRLDTRILSIGSSEEYGNVSKDDMPLTEHHPLNPISPYAVARVSQELLSNVYCDAYGMNIVLTRSFNHVGPGQREIFVVPSFAKQLTEIKKKGLKHGQIETGDVAVIRDFIDVRDVVEAYHLLLKDGRVGDVYNICSGRGVSLEETIDLMSDMLGINVDIKVNEKLIRPNDNKIIVGSNKKMRDDLGWESKIAFRESISDLLNYWQARA